MCVCVCVYVCVCDFDGYAQAAFIGSCRSHRSLYIAGCNELIPSYHWPIGLKPLDNTKADISSFYYPIPSTSGKNKGCMTA